jgi:tape measure domain-containing protein
MVATVGSIEVLLKLVGADKYAVDFRGTAAATEAGAKRIDTAIRGASKSTADLGTSMAALTRGNSALNSLALSTLRATTSVESLTRGFTALGAAVGGITGALATKVVTDYADAYTNIQNKLSSVLAQTKDRVAAEQEIFDIAQRSRASFGATAQLYQRLTLSSKGLGASQTDILKVVETTQKALATGGATSAEQGSITTQLSQALGSGRLQGDELRSIGENSPVLIQAIAKEFGVAVGELKELGSEGKLTSDRVFKAILNASADVEEAFARSTPTIAAGIQQIDNALLRYIGQTDKALGASEKLTGGLKFVADNIKSIGDAAQYAVALVGANIFSRLLTNTATAAIAPIAKVRADARLAVTEARAAQQSAQASLSQARQALLNIDRDSDRNRLGFADRNVAREAIAAQKALARAEAARTPNPAAIAEAQRRLNDAVARQNDNANRNVKAAAAAATAEIQKQTVALAAANTAMATAQRSATTLASALASVGNIGRVAFSGLVGALGGGFNAALTGVGVALVAYSIYQARAAEQARLYKEALDTVPDALKRLTAAQDANNASISAANDLRAARANANAQLATIQTGIEGASNDVIAGVSNAINNSALSRPDVKGLQGLYKELLNTREGGVLARDSLTSLIAALESLSGRSPNLAAAVAEVLGLARALQAATGQAGALRIALAGGYDDPRDLIAKAEKARQEGIARSAVAKIDEMVGKPEVFVPKIVAEQIEKQFRDQASKNSKVDFENRVQTRISANPGIFTQDQVRRQLRAEDAIGESEKKRGGAKKSPEVRAAETLSKKLTELGQDSAVAGLSDLDQKTVRFAQSAKVAAGNIDEFIKALQSGDLSKIPPEMEKIRQEIEKLEATKFARGQLDELFPARKLETQLRQLAIAAKTMPEVARNFDELEQKIRVSNAPDWAKDSASAIGDFATTAITDFDNIGDAAENLGKQLLNIALRATIMKPLENGITSLLGGLSGGGGFNILSLFGLGGSSGGGNFGTGASVAAMKMHSGGLGGVDGNRIRVPAAAFINAPRFHTGLGSKEFAAVLEQGERVLTSRQSSRTASTVAGLSAVAATPNPAGKISVQVVNRTTGQVQETASSSQNPDGSIDVVVDLVEARTAQRVARGQGSLSSALRATASGRQLRG